MKTTETVVSPPKASLDGVRRGRMIVGAVMFAVGAVYTAHAFTLPMGTTAQPGAAMYPIIVGAGCLVISVLTMAEARFTTKVTGEYERAAPGRGRFVLGLGGIIVVYLLLLPLIGQYLAAALFGAAAVGVLGTRPWWKAVLHGVLLGLIISYVFLELLGVRLPAGALMGG
ncbi:tripartite tricarboxylate transporter TctB family protein [Nonomuraea sp. K274]|uniref:Tripartite tricarboxylate transporter TctB family protein n=1 Tax=Nonomuraea cypriaca TaxID=1187855 RepID=A0A931A8Z5_9ACTN|nr:tripartite tricarboxylate transporter TctB family protein [Nonomuraea cypriaca]MBF8185012.1 tripartite tricarboxylate transporter TctB family protein [Nonomuraea cypriaca]